MNVVTVWLLVFGGISPANPQNVYALPFPTAQDCIRVLKRTYSPSLGKCVETRIIVPLGGAPR